MLGPYIAALLFGGVLLALSLLAGGHDDAQADGDGDAHADGDGDAHGEAHADHGPDDHGHAHAHAGSFGGLLSTFASLRFWTFFFAFGGGAGLALTLAGLPSLVTAVAAALMGGGAGFAAALTFRYLGRRDLTSALSAEDWIGRTAKVTVPVSPDRPGKVLLSFENEVKELVALSAGETDGAMNVGEEVLVVSMTDGVAKVTPNKPGARVTPPPKAVKSSS